MLGVDIADGGKDSTRAGVMDDGVLSEIIEIPVDPVSTVDTAEQTALGIIKIAQQRGINPQDVGIDGVGVGAGVRAILRSRGGRSRCSKVARLQPSPAIRTCDPSSSGRQARICAKAASAFMSTCPTSLSFETSYALISTPMTTRSSGLRRRIRGAEPKSVNRLKNYLGRSPDRADCFVIARWVNAGSGDARNDQSRIAL